MQDLKLRFVLRLGRMHQAPTSDFATPVRLPILFRPLIDAPESAVPANADSPETTAEE